VKRIVCLLAISAAPFGGALGQTVPGPIVTPIMQRISLTSPEKRY